MEDIITKGRLNGMIYHLVAKCFKIPDESLIDERVVEGLSELLDLVNEEIADLARNMLETLNSTDNMEVLKVEYAKLFIGPKELLAPPYGSLYLEENGEIMGPSTMDAINMYSKAGLKKSQDFKEPPDHIRVELEFLQYLNSKIVESYEEENYEEGKRYIEIQEEFVERHIGSWVRPFTNNIIMNTENEFYKNLALVTQSII